MTSPSAPARARRLGLYGPFAALAIAAVAWSFGWFWLKGQAERGLDAAAARRVSAGGQLTWSSRRVSGYPFRIDIDFTDLAWREPTGWGLQAPTLRAEASVFSSDHWVAVALAGATLIRPGGGDVAISARVLRASLSRPSSHPPAISVEGLDLTFTPAPGAAPYALKHASELHIHTRPGPDDQGAAYLELDGVREAPAGVWAIASGQPVTMIVDGIWSHAGALSGASWERAVNAWSAAGGRLEVRRLHVQAGPTTLDAKGAGLTSDPGGRLAGALDATLTGCDPALDALAAVGAIDPTAAKAARAVAGQATPAHAPLAFKAGRLSLGGATLADAPKVY